jgi:hypothetical protein
MTKIYDIRQELKGRLYILQGRRCALSNLVTDQLDMHEWLVARSDLPIKRLQPAIFHEINCILLTRASHELPGMARDYRCLRYKLKTHTIQDIQDWLESLNLKTFGTLKQWIDKHETALSISPEKSVWINQTTL